MPADPPITPAVNLPLRGALADARELPAGPERRAAIERVGRAFIGDRDVDSILALHRTNGAVIGAERTPRP
jgi:hypothetical protein